MLSTHFAIFLPVCLCFSFWKGPAKKEHVELFPRPLGVAVSGACPCRLACWLPDCPCLWESNCSSTSSQRVPVYFHPVRGAFARGGATWQRYVLGCCMWWLQQSCPCWLGGLGLLLFIASLKATSSKGRRRNRMERGQNVIANFTLLNHPALRRASVCQGGNFSLL